jgi:glycosyltransferase involved in cell wall biosynthesis
VAGQQKGLNQLPKFSVIIPTHNRPEFLPDAVASVLRQSLTDFELLIVNDGDANIQTFEDPRVRVLNNQQRGAVLARILGVDEAQADFIAFLDDDDVWSRVDHLAHAAETLAQHTDFYFADGVLKFPDGKRKRFAKAADAESLEHDNTILISAVAYKRILHESLGSFDVGLPYYWDWDWYLRVARHGARLQRRAETVVDIRIHGQNMSGESNQMQRQANLNLLCAKHGLTDITLKGHVDFL